MTATRGATVEENDMEKQSLLSSVLALTYAAAWAEVPPPLKPDVVEDSSTLVLCTYG